MKIKKKLSTQSFKDFIYFKKFLYSNDSEE